MDNKKLIALYGTADENKIIRSKEKQKQVRVFAAKKPTPVKLSAEKCRGLCDAAGINFEEGYETRVLDYLITNETLDRYGDKVRIAGAKLDNYLKNPVVMFCHQHANFPVGNSIKLRKENAVKAMFSWALFADDRADPSGRSDLTFRMAASGFMKANSIGFIPIRVHRPMDEQERDELGLGKYGVEFIEWELLEHSPCGIPANPDALENAIKDMGDGIKMFRSEDIDLITKSNMFEDMNLLDMFAESLKGRTGTVSFPKMEMDKIGKDVTPEPEPEPKPEKKDGEAKPVEVVDNPIPNKDWICPHCKEVIREKSLFYDTKTDEWFHRPCIKAGPIILPPSDYDEYDLNLKSMTEPVPDTTPVPDPPEGDLRTYIAMYDDEVVKLINTLSIEEAKRKAFTDGNGEILGILADAVAKKDDQELDITSRKVISITETDDSYTVQYEKHEDEHTLTFDMEIDNPDIRELMKDGETKVENEEMENRIATWIDTTIKQHPETGVYLRPFPNEHACRIKSPSGFDKFARKNCHIKSDGKCIDVIFGIKDGKSQIQAFRYPKDTWRVSDARKHCKDNKGLRFEPASKKDSPHDPNAGPPININVDMGKLYKQDADALKNFSSQLEKVEEKVDDIAKKVETNGSSEPGQGAGGQPEDKTGGGTHPVTLKPNF